jgi:hypothetical protein
MATVIRIAFNREEVEATCRDREWTLAPAFEDNPLADFLLDLLDDYTVRTVTPADPDPDETSAQAAVRAFIREGIPARIVATRGPREGPGEVYH